MSRKIVDNGFSPSSSPNNNTIKITNTGGVIKDKRGSATHKPKERTISVFEHNLTYHVRQTLHRLGSSSTSPKNRNSSVEELRKQKKEHLDKLTLFGYVLALLSALSAGSVMIISLYSSTWITLLHYNSLQVNLISSCINMGAYLLPPLLGFICDTHGPVTLSLISFFAFVPHYYYLSKAASVPVEEVKHFGWILYSFFMVGCGTSSLFFASLIPCSKFFSDSKILSISMPTTLYGSSSVIFAYVLTHCKKFKISAHTNENPQEQYYKLNVVFKYIAIFYSIVIVLNYLAATIVTHIKLEYEILDQKKSEEIETHQPLLNTSNNNYAAINDDEALSTDTEDAVFDLTPSSSTDKENHETNQTILLKDKVSLFLKNEKTLLIFLIVFLSIGSLETYISNMASISKLYSSEENVYSPQAVLSNFSICSTVIRFFVGFAIDMLTKYFGKEYKNIDLYLMMFFLFLGLFSQWALYTTTSHLTIISGLMGITYGGLFTIFPIISLNHYDKDIFAIAYGCFLVAPAGGTPSFSMIFAKIFDRNHCSASLASFDCINSVFLVTSTAFGICLVLGVLIRILSNKKDRSTVIV